MPKPKVQTTTKSEKSVKTPTGKQAPRKRGKKKYDVDELIQGLRTSFPTMFVD